MEQKRTAEMSESTLTREPNSNLSLYNRKHSGVIICQFLHKVFIKYVQVRSTAVERSLLDRIVNSISLLFTMGLTWTFGYFLLIPFTVEFETAMQWLFITFNTFQVLMFY